MIDTVYKLTNQDNTTYNITRWGPGVTHTGTGKGELCGRGFIHAYTHPLLAVLLNPIHGNFANPKLWRCETAITKNDRGLKVGGISLTTIEEMPLPNITTHQRILFAFLCVEKLQIPGWDKCVELVRSRDYAAADAAANAAANAAYAAYAAADAAYAAAEAARAARAAARVADAAYAAAEAARAAAYAAAFAAHAAPNAVAAAAAVAAAVAARADAACVVTNLDLIAIALEACRG